MNWCSNDAFAIKLFGMTRAEAGKQNICMRCRKKIDIVEFKFDAWTHFRNGLCSSCYDNVIDQRLLEMDMTDAWDSRSEVGRNIADLISQSIDVHQKSPNRVENSIPILYFGDIASYTWSPIRIVTVGLNPSNNEFPVKDRFQRFPLAKGFDHVPRNIQQALNNYFCTVPYMSWFNSIEPLLNGLDASYDPRSRCTSSVLHTDLLSPVATSPTWSGLNPPVQRELSRLGVPLWHSLINSLRPNILIISVGKNHLENIRFPKIGEESLIYSFPQNNREYEFLHSQIRLDDGHTTDVIFGQASRRPFMIPNTQKREAGKAIKQFLVQKQTTRQTEIQIRPERIQQPRISPRRPASEISTFEPCWLSELTAETIKTGSFPLHDILSESLYYPSSGFDGDPVKYLGKYIQSFIYVDYGHTREKFDHALKFDGFRGYEILAQRDVAKEELVPQGWSPSLPLASDGDPARYSRVIKTPFCSWVVMQRKDDMPAYFGPHRFSLLYLCADGVAAFQALYLSNNVTPQAVAIIQPGHGFGNNWTDITDPKLIFARTVLSNPAGTPEFLLFGGHGDSDYYEKPCWPEYSGQITNFVTATHKYIGVWRRVSEEIKSNGN